MSGSFTCPKVGTWDRLFNFPSEGRRAEDFLNRKNPMASAGFEPANSGTRGQRKGQLIFQKYGSHLKILDTRRVNMNKFHTENPKILGAS
jgi:hypothetical protein